MSEISDPLEMTAAASRVYHHLLRTGPEVRAALLAEWEISAASLSKVATLVAGTEEGRLHHQIDRVAVSMGAIIPRFSEPEFDVGIDTSASTERHSLNPFFPRESGSRKAS